MNGTVCLYMLADVIACRDGWMCRRVTSAHIHTRTRHPVTTPVRSPVNPNDPSIRIDYCITLHAIVAVGLLVLYLIKVLLLLYLFIYILASWVLHIIGSSIYISSDDVVVVDVSS